MDKKQIHGLIRLIQLVLMLLLVCSSLIVVLMWEESHKAKENTVLGCGVIDYDGNKFPNSQLMSAKQQAGRKLFMKNCESCHTPTDQLLVGPSLKGITKRKSEKWIIAWIQNSRQVVNRKDKYALALMANYNNVQMPAYPDIPIDSIRAILAYIDWF